MMMIVMLTSIISQCLVSAWSVTTNHDVIPTNANAVLLHQEIFPRTIMLDPHWLVKMKQSLKQNDSIIKDFVEKTVIEADLVLTKKPTSVVEKKQLPPSGNKHDFFSLAAYEWPNPNTPDGLPYISRDGQKNPEIYTILDNRNLEEMVYRVMILAIANYFTGDDKYNLKAQELLRVWFLDKDTYMNPNLQFGEYERGKGILNPSGIMGGVLLPQLSDAMALLQQSPKWNKNIEQGMESWFSEYLYWLLNSDSGKREGNRMNNHGTYYNVQVGWIALYLNKTDFTKKHLESMMQDLSSAPLGDVSKLIAVRINPDGTQPFELERATSLHYSMYNLLGLFQLATIGEHVGIDLWNYEIHGVGLRKALDFIIPYALNEQTWPYEQVEPIIKDEFARLSCQAIQHYNNNQSYSEAYKSVDIKSRHINLDYPICDTISKNSS
jgi:hypothetical protein